MQPPCKLHSQRKNIGEPKTFPITHRNDYQVSVRNNGTLYFSNFFDSRTKLECDGGKVKVYDTYDDRESVADLKTKTSSNGDMDKSCFVDVNNVTMYYDQTEYFIIKKLKLHHTIVK